MDAGKTQVVLPRRVLSLDGGGIRGAISLGVLEHVERWYRERSGQPALVLRDVFDMFAGTSTGAIIAACLAWGEPVDAVIRLYREHGRAMFCRSPLLKLIRARYRADALAEMFRGVFVEADGSLATLGSQRLSGRLLQIVLRNATTGSAWPVTNNPYAAFNDRTLAECNLKIPLWQLLRASTAAPTFFPPEQITLGSKTFTFIDGGITPYNNPSLLALLTVAMPEYRVNWPTGVDRLFLLSVGTGRTRAMLPVKPLERLNLVDHVLYLPPALLGSIAEQQDMMCRVLGQCVHGEEIDSEIGDMKLAGLLPTSTRLCRYARVNPWIDSHVPLDAVDRVDELLEIGRSHGQQATRGLS